MLRPWPLIQIADSQNAARAAGESWTFSTIDAAIEAVVSQVGYGWLPEERIQPLLEQGLLKILPLNHGVRRATPLHLIVKRTSPRWMSRLKPCCAFLARSRHHHLLRFKVRTLKR
jgi:DNA-binding transcriptional LysR family regulator